MSDKKNISINIESSKSLMNRALICQSYFPELNINGFSNADDVKFLKNCLADLAQNKNEFYCGSGGTTFRFFVLRASRKNGKYILNASERLLHRPQDEIRHIGEQLGFTVLIDKKALVQTTGWKAPAANLKISQEISSQFLSAVLLNSWMLESDLKISIEKGHASDSYLQMTVDFLKNLGMEINRSGSEIKVPAGQSLKVKEVSVEPDMSSSFFVASLARPNRQIILQGFPQSSLQPDFIFTKILKEMGFIVDTGKNLVVTAPSTVKPINLDLENTPDLFPVLAVLCARARGISKLSGLKNLAHKESNRLQRMTEFLQKLGVTLKYENDVLEITGKPDGFPSENIILDSDEDHRLVMAGTVAKSLGANVMIKSIEVIGKSFPQFFQLQKEFSL